MSRELREQRPPGFACEASGKGGESSSRSLSQGRRGRGTPAGDPCNSQMAPEPQKGTKPGARPALLAPQPSSGSRSTAPHVPGPLQIVMVKAGGCGGPRGWWRVAECSMDMDLALGQGEGELPPGLRALAREAATGSPGAKRGESTRGESGTDCCLRALPWPGTGRPRLWPPGRDGNQPDPGQLPPPLENGQKQPLPTKC